MYFYSVGREDEIKLKNNIRIQDFGLFNCIIKKINIIMTSNYKNQSKLPFFIARFQSQSSTTRVAVLKIKTYD